jgi:general secretion pathway protein K
MALLAVLILVAIMAALAAAALGRMRLSTRLGGNALQAEQGRLLAVAAADWAALRLTDLVRANPSRLTAAGGWLGRPVPVPLPGGEAIGRVTDGGNCFNLNSLVRGPAEGPLVAAPAGRLQFEALMAELGISELAARRVAASLSDWLDSDDAPVSGGAERETYARASLPHAPGNTLLAEPSELRAVAGVSPELYAALRPWVCALPTTELSPLNVNTLTPAQAPLLAMLAPGQLTVEAARRLIEARPAEGWESAQQFWATPPLDAIEPEPDVLRQVSVRTRWFTLGMRVRVGESELAASALIDAGDQPARVMALRYTEEE